MPTLTHQQMLEATHLMEPYKFSAGEAIMHEDMPGDHFYIVTKGEVEVALKRPGGIDVEVGRMKEGEYFGEIEMFSGSKAIATVRAGFLPVEVLALDREPFLALMNQSEQTRDALQHIINKRENENILARARK
jgi:CRP-like cAMP-binding protein